MRIVILGPAYPYRGGIANFNEALCSEYIKQGKECEIITYTLQYPSFLFPGKTQFTKGIGPEDIRITRLINSSNPFNWIRVARAIIAKKPDYIIVPFWIPYMSISLASIIRLVKRKTSARAIAITHNITPHERKPGDKLFTRFFIKSCDGYIALAESVLQDISKFTIRKNKKFVPHPIYNTFGKIVSREKAIDYLKLDTNQRYILFFGMIRQYKGLDLLLRAMDFNKVRELKLKLIIAGEFYDDRERYDSLIKDFKLDEFIYLTDNYVINNEVKHFFAASDMVVQPYKTATQSGVTQIAYHFERPMLVTDVGGLSEIVPHNKVGYVAKADAESIADCIVDFYTNNKAAEFEQNIIKEKKRFTWDKMVDAIEDLVANIS